MLDILIIGSGPAGLNAGIYAKRAGYNVVIAEKEYEGAGQIVNSSRVDNYIGLPEISGYDLGERFRKHAEMLNVEFYEGEAVSIDQEDDIYITTFENDEKIKSKTVIYAAGCTHRRLNCTGEDKYMGKGISYCAICDGAFFKNKNVAVIGGGNTALDDALYLSDICNKVYVIHRRNEFRGSVSTFNKLKLKDNVKILTNTQVTEIAGDKKVEEVILDNGKNISVDGVFVAIGMIPETKILTKFDILDDNGYVIADESCKTKIKGLFVAGDVRNKSLRQVITAAADGANAVYSLNEIL